jgi:sorbitol/mannitol transport system permease protein
MAMKSSASRARFFGILAWTLGILMFFPILWTAIAAFKSESDAYSLPQTLFVTPWTMENFAEVQSRSDYLAYLAWSSPFQPHGPWLLRRAMSMPAS